MPYASSPSTTPRRAIARASLAPAILLLLPVLFVGLYVHAYPTFSPIDEFQHVDYLYRVHEGTAPKPGDHVRQRVMRDEACRGLDAQFALPACGKEHYDPAEFQELGEQTAAAHPPLYYALADGVARALAIGGDVAGELMTRARLAGAAWLAIGLVLCLMICRQLGIRDRASLPALLVLASSVSLLQSSSTVSPDSVALAAGAAVLLAAIHWDRRRTRGAAAIFIACAFVLGALKSLFIIATGAACVYLLARAIRKRHDVDRPFRAELAIAMAVLGANAASVIGWLVIQRLRAPNAPQTSMDLRFHVDSLSGANIFSQLPSVLQPISSPPLPPFLATGSIGVVTLLSSLLVLVGLFGAFLWRSLADEIGAVVLAGASVAAASGGLLTVLNFVVISAYIAIPARYGYPLLPFMVVPLAAAADTNRRAAGFTWLLAATATLVVGVTLSRTAY